MNNNTNDDLWPSDLTEQTLVSPITILMRQCQLIGEKTNFHILGEMRPLDSNSSKSLRSYGLILIAPGLENYRFPLLKIEYPLTSIYPISLESRQILIEESEDENYYKNWLIRSNEEFHTILSEILSHPTTVNAIRAMCAESKARGYNPDSNDDVPF